MQQSPSNEWVAMLENLLYLIPPGVAAVVAWFKYRPALYPRMVRQRRQRWAEYSRKHHDFLSYVDRTIGRTCLDRFIVLEHIRFDDPGLLNRVSSVMERRALGADETYFNLPTDVYYDSMVDDIERHGEVTLVTDEMHHDAMLRGIYRNEQVVQSIAGFVSQRRDESLKATITVFFTLGTRSPEPLDDAHKAHVVQVQGRLTNLEEIYGHA